MADKLYSLKDLEQIATEFDKPEGSFCYYQLCSFGYCTRCKSITEYTIELDERELDPDDINCNDDFYVVVCKKCNNKNLGNGFQPPDLYYTQDDKRIPDNLKDKIQKLNSKPQQKIYFRKALANYLKSKKHAHKEEKQRINKLKKI